MERPKVMIRSEEFATDHWFGLYVDGWYIGSVWGSGIIIKPKEKDGLSTIDIKATDAMFHADTVETLPPMPTPAPEDLLRAEQEARL